MKNITKIQKNLKKTEKNGENTDEIAAIIRKDLIDEFIIYVNIEKST